MVEEEVFEVLVVGHNLVREKTEEGSWALKPLASRKDPSLRFGMIKTGFSAKFDEMGY